MAKITLPHTLANGNTADGGEVQANFDAVIDEVNGELEGTNNIKAGGVLTANIADNAVTLAKLASSIKVIENTYSDYVPYYLNGSIVGSSKSVPSAETTIFSQAVTLSANRYLLFQYNYYVTDTGANYPVTTKVKDGSTEISHLQFDGTGYGMMLGFQFLKQITSGSHTFYFTLTTTENRSVTDRAFTIIQFGF